MGGPQKKIFFKKSIWYPVPISYTQLKFEGPSSSNKKS